MNDRVLRHQAKFFESEEDGIRFWTAFFKILDLRDYQINDYRYYALDGDDSFSEFKVAKMCEGRLNIISLSETQNYLWVGQLSSLDIKGLKDWIERKAQGDNSDKSNPFILLESFLRFNFNRRSANAMLNGLFAFFIKFQAEITSGLVPGEPLVENLNDQTILDHYLSLLLFMRKTVLPRFLSAETVRDMAERDINTFPYVYSFEIVERFKEKGLEPTIAKVITVSSYSPLPEWVARMSIHRELDHAVNDCFMRYKDGLLPQVSQGLFIEKGHFECRSVDGDLLYEANYNLRHDLKHDIKPYCMERKSKEHSCYLFDGLDVFSLIYLKINADPDTPNGLIVDLRCVPINASAEQATIVAKIKGVIEQYGFTVSRFRVDNPDDEWLLYSTEIEALIAMYIDDLVENKGTEINNHYDSIYIRERNIIQSRAEILNLR